MKSPSTRADGDSLYEIDFFDWTQRVAHDLRDGRLSEGDREYVAEEIAGLGKLDRRELRARTRVLIRDLLKWATQPERRNERMLEAIHDQRMDLELILRDSPSLSGVVQSELPRLFREAVEGAEDLIEAARACPFTPEQILGEWLPD